MSAPSTKKGSRAIIDPQASAHVQPPRIARIAVGVDGFPEGRDAVALAAAIRAATGAELLLVSVHPEPLVPMPREMGWSSVIKHGEQMLRSVRDAHAPGARVLAATDLSVPRALQGAVRRHHSDLLVVGSSRDAPEGTTRIGKRTRQLLCHFECALAVAPRGIHTRPEIELQRIGVGYDGGPESEAALVFAGSLARAAGAALQVRIVVDDRMPIMLRSALTGLLATEWREVLDEQAERLRDQAGLAAKRIGAKVELEMCRGRPADGLLALSKEVDALVIGSRRWGPAARVLLGSTGEALLHEAGCPVLAVPRPT
jgi:nucleotide-binding universal stress UspA family protein